MIIYILKYVEKNFFLIFNEIRRRYGRLKRASFFSGDHNFWSLERLKSKIKIDS